MRFNNSFSTLQEYTDYLYDRKSVCRRLSDACDLLARSDSNIEKVVTDASLSEQEYIEVIALRRREGYSKSTGGGNDAAGDQIDLMYRNTPMKFVEEFLQNADDCRYIDVPQIQIIVDEQISTVEFVYNEVGFTRQDIWALTAFAQSTKNDSSDDLLEIDEDGVFYKEKTGRKGIGFKSVFSLPAENICVHVRSNGYSFKLDNSIGRIIPIWEEDSCNDGKTHIAVELINLTDPHFLLSSIYPSFKELFCISDTKDFFKKNPVLFMHRLRDITITNVATNGSRDSFSVLMKYDSSRTEYMDPFHPDATILSGIRNSGTYYRRQYSFLEIYIKATNANKCIIPCVRETQMALIENQYRNLSVISPLILIGKKNTWMTGALFRTFPMMDHEISLPFAIDAPYELNSARKGIEYNNIGTARAINTAINRIIFERDGLLADFVMYLRNIDDIRIDSYMAKNAGTILFNNDSNRDDRGRRLVPEIDLMRVLAHLPVFRLFGQDGFGCLDEIVSVPSDLFNWLQAETFLNIIMRDKHIKIVSQIYAGSRLLRNQDIIGEKFANQLNEYLDILEWTYSRESKEYLMFFESQLYPYLKRNNKALAQEQAHKKLKVFLARQKTTSGEVILREAVNEGRWFRYSGKNNLSFGIYRIYESAPVSMEPVLSILKEHAHIKDLDYEFSPKNINITAKRYKEWPDIRMFIEAALYYGYDKKSLEIKALKQYAAEKECDPSYNPFRDAGVLTIIPKEEIESLTPYFESTSAVINYLKNAAGLNNGLAYGRPNGSFTEFLPETIKLLKTGKEDIIEPFLNRIAGAVKDKGKRINLTYQEIESCSVPVKVMLLRRSKMFAVDAYSAICDDILSDEQYRKESSDILSELIIRARNGAKKNHFPEDCIVNISLQYLLEKKLAGLARKVLVDRGFKQVRILNNDYFSELPKDNILSMIGALAPDKVDSHMADDACVHFFGGNLSSLPEDKRFLEDGSGKTVYLNLTDRGDYTESLAQYLDTSFDPEALNLIAEFEEQNRDVKENWIFPALEDAEHNLKEAYKILEMSFDEMSNEEYIRILSWFRFQSYSEVIGTNPWYFLEDIENDYKATPWHFVYEFIQNVDDCVFSTTEIDKKLEVAINEKTNSITFTYNEVGFSREDIEAITSWGNSQKGRSLEKEILGEGLFDLEKTGRMGRGFKSVFALPGKNIVVHIRSNGYSFKFIKRLGLNIPVWEDATIPEKGTQIIVEGFSSASLSSIYEKMRDMFCVNNIERLFADCPALYLRKLKSVAITNGKERFSVKTQITASYFSEEEFETGGITIASGIYHAGSLRKSEYDDLLISIQKNEEKDINIEAVRYSEMFLTNRNTRTVSVTAPIFRENSAIDFKRGSLFRTLPMGKNTFRLPLTINAPFELDKSRSRVLDAENVLNNMLIRIITQNIFPVFYRHLREIDDVAIERYIAANNDYLFEGYLNLKKISLGELTKQLKVLKTYDGESYVDYKSAKALPYDCYDWPETEQLIAAFAPEDAGVIVDRAMVNSHLNISKVNLITADFVEHINMYLDGISETDSAELWPTIDCYILPLITRQYTELHNVYYEHKSVEELKKLKVFGFYMVDGSCVREAATDNSIWLQDCPAEYAGYGYYRSLNNAPVQYSDENQKWMRELHEFVGFQKAFSRESIVQEKIRNWTAAKQLIETVLYYRVQVKFKIPYLKRCVLSETYDHEPNVFRDAYNELQNNNIISHYISDDDIIDIFVTVGDASGVDEEDIVRVILQLGVRTGKDFFAGNQDTLRLNEETQQLLKEYCVTREKSEYLLELISEELVEEKKDRRFIVDYKMLNECQPVFIACFFKKALLEQEDLRRLAEKFYNDKDNYDCPNPDFQEALLYSLTFLADNQISLKRKLAISLSEIITRRLGNCIQKAVMDHGSSVDYQITLDCPVEEYPGERISTALKWLNDSDSEQTPLSKTYAYYVADLRYAFPVNTQEKHMYLCDSRKVVLNQSSADGSLRSFVHAFYKGKDDDFSTLFEIIAQQEELKNWTGSKRTYVEKLARFRKTTGKITSVLYPTLIDTINYSNGSAIAYIVPELLQNINDCPATPDQDTRSLQIDVDYSSGEMKLTYEEAGFDFANVYSITALGQSSKHDKSEGEKGLGFKKVFTLFDSVEIYSNEFFFKLTKKEPTIPSWIDDKNTRKSNVYPNGTTMLFHTKDITQLRKLTATWKKLFQFPYSEKIVSPLFLENIDSYELHVKGESPSFVTRDQILQNYYVQKEPLFESYKALLSENLEAEDVDLHLNNIQNDLRTRMKCQAMTDEMFEEYLRNISVSVAFPKSIEKKIEGTYFSTLPTTTPTDLALYINLPLELTTGRDEVLEDGSAYNRRVFEMLFNSEEGGLSVFGSILQKAAKDMPDKEVFEYLKDDIAAWISKVSGKNERIMKRHKDELRQLLLFHAYPNGELISLNESYSLDHIVYQYIQNSDNIRNDIEEWMHQHSDECMNLRLLYIRKAPVKTCEALENYVKTLELPEGYFPFTLNGIDCGVEYFRDEYGALEVKEDE